MRILVCVLLGLLGIGPFLAHADVKLGATRVIFLEGQREQSLMVHDRSHRSEEHTSELQSRM